MSYNLGLMALRSLCEAQSPLTWQNAKLSTHLFKGTEVPVFEWVRQHVQKHHALPKVATLEGFCQEIAGVEAPEPPSYYLEHLENRYFRQRINDANIKSQEILKEDQTAHAKATLVLQEVLNDITAQKYRARILDVGLEGKPVLLQEYHSTLQSEDVSSFGWPYLDGGGFVRGGDVVSFIGRPASGKTWLTLFSALHNWIEGKNVLFVSMEMAILPILQRIAAMYAGTNITQLKQGGYANFGKNNLYDAFVKGIEGFSKEQGKLYIVDGNLAASAEDVFVLADQLKCSCVFIDGAYLMRHKNFRLDRYTRAAENAEIIKHACSDLQMSCFSSWQFNREAVKGKKKNEEPGLEDIAYSDVIGQISSIVLGLFQEEGVETLKERQIRVLKGRNGEVGKFSIHWDFLGMDFSQVKEKKKGEVVPLQFV